MRKALKETDGLCVSVDGLETVSSLNWLRRHGFLVESTSAVVLGALWKLVERGEIEKNLKVLLPLTGSGLKLTQGI